MSERISRRGVVCCRAFLDVPLSARVVWGQLRDFQRFARQDPFHATINIEGGAPRAGASLTLSHRYAGLRIARGGRILVWREEVGYSFSDLSQRGPRHGFPHVFSFRLEPHDNACRLKIEVRGLWTTRWIPRWLARIWLRWVFTQIVRHVEQELILFRLWHKRRELVVAATPV
ncbi:MAG TPA: hypothetical protein VH370_21975 [Humisphaera sp.]|jgi:hypothetical protein|nr:hypothetical protein [Humisphaera sp.]